MQLKESIEKAAAIAGSQQELAAQLGVSFQRLSDWKYGRVQCPPEWQAVIADLAGLDAQETLVRATVNKHHGTPLGERLRAALKKFSRGTGAEGPLHGYEIGATVAIGALLGGKIVPLIEHLRAAATMYRPENQTRAIPVMSSVHAA